MKPGEEMDRIQVSRSLAFRCSGLGGSEVQRFSVQRLEIASNLKQRMLIGPSSALSSDKL